MTRRKPPGVKWQTWIDKQIEQGRQEGAFDDLPGYGKPIASLGRPRDELWWVREKLKREDVEYLPPALRVAKEREDALVDAMAAPTEQAAVELLEAVNKKIRYVNSHVIEGPPSTSVIIDVEDFLTRWRAVDRPAPAPVVSPVEAPVRRRWWQRSGPRRPATPG